MKPLLVVDGYNVIGAWTEAEKQGWPLDACRDKLLHLLQDLSAWKEKSLLTVALCACGAVAIAQVVIK